MIRSVFLLMCLLTLIKSGDANCIVVDMQPSYFQRDWPRPINMSAADGIIYPVGRTYANITIMLSGLFPHQADKGKQYIYSMYHMKFNQGVNDPFISNYSYYTEPFDNGFVVRIGANSNITGSSVVGSANATVKKIYPALMLGSVVGKFPSNKTGRYFNHTLVILPEKCGTQITALYCVLQPKNQTNCTGHTTYTSYVLVENKTCSTDADGNLKQSLQTWFDLKDCLFEKKYNVSADEREEWFGITQDQQGVHLYTSRKNGFKSNNMFLFATLPIYERLRYYTVMPRSIKTTANNDHMAWSAFYIYQLHKLNYLVEFDVEGYIVRASDCGANDYTQLQCSYGQFDMNSGVYSASYFNAQPRGYYYVANELEECALDVLFKNIAPQIANYSRRVFTNCNYNLTKLLSLVEVDEFVCDKTTPESLATGCYSSLVVDWFALPLSMKSTLAIGSAEAISMFNYNQDYSNPTCRIHATINSNVSSSLNFTANNNYAYISRCQGTDGKPILLQKGQLPNIACRSGVLGLSNDVDYFGYNFNGRIFYIGRKSYTPRTSEGSIQMVYVITANYAEGPNNVCPLKDTTTATDNLDSLLGQCIDYDINGVVGQGVFQKCNSTGIPSQVFVYDSFHNIIGYHSKNGTYYCMAPCVSVPVSVIYDKSSNSHATLYGSVACDHIKMIPSVLSRETATKLRASDNGLLQTAVGCVIGFHNTSDTVEDCNLPLGQSLCAKPPSLTRSANNTFGLAVMKYENPLKVEVLNSSEFEISVPTNFSFRVTEEFIETSIQKVTVDCKQYVCNGFERCEQLLEQYGQFCAKINQALHGVNLRQDDATKSLFESIRVPQSAPLMASLSGDYNLSLFETPSINTGGSGNYRSALEDLLFDKVTLSDPGYMKGYDECMKKGPPSARDLICAQYVAGYKVLPPLYDSNMEAMYTASLTGSIAGALWTGGLSSAASLPFAQSIYYRMNGIGITQNVLMENQKLIANKFNQALGAMQTGFTTTNQAFQKVQDAVNANAQALSKLASELSNTFGAISASIGDILKRLDTLEQEVQIDRLINGRLTSLNAFVSQQLVRSEAAARSSQLVKDKVNECVKSQSSRNGFCGQGTHIVSFAVNAPNGFYFVHVGYHPTDYVNQTSAYGLCDSSNTKCIAAKNGYFIKNGSDDWMFTGSSYYQPEPITNFNSRSVEPEVTFQNLTNNLPPPLSNSTDVDFKDELEEFFKNITSEVPNFGSITQINSTVLDLSEEMKTLQSVVEALNQSYIELKELGNYTYYNKWPWYVWLGFIAGLVALALCLFFILCCTGCGTSCMGKLNCTRCCDKYDDYDLQPEKIHIH
nr:spike glycoprotein [Erinaceus hedgehog coronavirus HKU31]